MNLQTRFGIFSTAIVLSFLLTTSAYAFDCPNKFQEAEAIIGKVSAAVKKLSGQKKAEVHMLLDDAKMLLNGAKHNHEKPQGKMDHARSIAKAVSAKGYAEAALILAKK